MHVFFLYNFFNNSVSFGHPRLSALTGELFKRRKECVATASPAPQGFAVLLRLPENPTVQMEALKWITHRHGVKRLIFRAPAL